MCGIAGFAGTGSFNDLNNMNAAIRHRGPDGEGTFKDAHAPVFLGHTRLAIVDLEGGAQPMHSRDQQISVVFNGEIYNHQELREQLEARGHCFSTDHSDTEVLIHGWREWKHQLPERLNGMFAFAIWDKQAGSIFIARDRFGEKPLFWAQQNNSFIFASELSAIQAHSSFESKLNSLSLKKYFAYGYIPAPNSLYEQCHKLPGGHWLAFDLESSNIQQQQYWAYHIEPQEPAVNDDELAEQLFELIIKATKRRLMSDVPLGVFLSGGIDSSTIVAAASSIQPPSALQTFSIGFDNPSFDESSHAALVADYFGAQNHLKVLDIQGASSLLDEVLGQLDEPMSDPSILPTYLLCQFTRQHVKVALSGDGGDELFAGYDPFKALQPASLYSKAIPNLAHKSFRSLAELLPKSNKNMSFDFKVRRFLQGLSFESSCWNPAWMAPLEPSDIEELFNEKTDAEELYSEAINQWNRDSHLDTLDRSLEFFTNFYLQDDILVKVDRASMMNGLESRAVFLDPDIAEFSRTLPNRYKLRGNKQKYILRKALEQHLPQSIIDRPKKGFGIPLMDWLKDLPIHTERAPQLNLNQSEIDRQINAHLSGKSDYRLALWSWLVASKSIN